MLSMASQAKGLRRICRYCLRRDDLLAFSECNILEEDAIRYTGIPIPQPSRNYAICSVCCTTIQNAAQFRRTCSKNDIIFRKLVNMLIEKGKMRTAEVRTDHYSDAIDSNVRDSCLAQDARSETSILKVEQSDSDDNVPSIVEEKKSRRTNRHARLQATDAFEPEDTKNSFTSSLHIEVLSEAASESVAVDIAPKEGCFTNTIELEDEEIETLDNSFTSDPQFLDGTESDYSLPSLYGEAMTETIDNQSDTEAQEKSRYESRQLCPLCGCMTFNLNTHIKKLHLMEKKVCCPHCPKKFMYKFDLKRHINTWHEKRIILTCEHCGKGFINHNSHYYHMKNLHGESDVYECEICERKFKSIDGYKKHMKEHSLTSYPCQHCEKLFKSSVTLEKHNRRYHASAS